MATTAEAINKVMLVNYCGAATNFYAKLLMRENKSSAIRFQLVCPTAVDTPLINQAKDNGPKFLKNAQITKKNIISPEADVLSVERCIKNIFSTSVYQS